MKKLQPRDGEAIAEVEAVVERIRNEWLREPNIVAIGPAIKLVDDVPQVDTLCIRFHVIEKLPSEHVDSRGWRMVPAQIEEIPTDVSAVAAPPLQLLETRTRRFDPLLGGIAVGNVNRTAVGTLGGIVFHNDDGRAVGLTNEHVLIFTDQGQTGDPVDQPRSGSGDVIGIVDADCCPGGQLTVKEIPNPIRDTALTIAAAAAIAAALSDEADPHRRGQDATPVAEGERTLRERVEVAIRYPEFPLPGTEYEVDVRWAYERETDRRTLTHRVDETRRNPHILDEQWLVTDRTRYSAGEVTNYLAALVPRNRKERCRPFHVVAHVAAPSGSSARRTILRPVLERERVEVRRLFGESLSTRTCVDFQRFEGGQRLGRELRHEGFRFRSLGRIGLSVVDVVQVPTGQRSGRLTFPGEGLEVVFPFAVSEVTAEVAAADESSVTLRGFDRMREVASDTGPGLGETPFTLGVSGNMTSARVEGGDGRGSIVRLCIMRSISDEACLYWGHRRITPTDETGVWSGYLFAQTVNDVVLERDPLEAAKTIGGLAISHNLVVGPNVQTLGYGDACAIEAAADVTFELEGPP
jgi:hypothetical protein